MATKTKKRTGEKSKAVRAYLEANPDAPVGQVVADLKKQGISISPAIVYQIRSAPKKASSKKTKSPAASSANGAAEHGSKSDAVRAALKQLGRTAPAKDVLNYLAAKGITVSEALIVKVKSRTKPGKRGRPTMAAAVVPAGSASPSVETLSLDNLLATKKLADELGGVGSLRNALDVLETLR